MKTRFAPSPTGYLHIGGARTALFSWLHARHHGGRFVLRVEDTDRERSTQEAVDIILEGMQWLGLDYDEGPYFQSERLERYQELGRRLIDEGQAYYCYCTQEELDEMRAAQKARGENPRYDGRWRDREGPRDGVDPVVRFKTPQEGEVVIEDLVRGTVTYDNAMLDDLVILRADGTPTFHFCNVIDDADMGITHVIRGDDHLNNTARHIHMIDAMGFPRPTFAHMPLIMAEDGAKLSKRHGAVNVLEYREEGYLPEALVNYLARLGWSHGDQEVFSREELIELFDVNDVNASASRFSVEKLTWLNQQYIMAADPDDLVPPFTEQLGKLGYDPAAGPDARDIVIAYRERATTLRELAATVFYLYEDNIKVDEGSAKKQLRPVMLEPVRTLVEKLEAIDDWSAANVHSALEAAAEVHGLKFGKIGQPVRVAVTGGPVSPPIDVTMELVGKRRTLQRLGDAVTYMEARAANS